MKLDELPFRNREVVDEQLRLGKKCDEAVGNPQLLGGLSRIHRTPTAPAIQRGTVLLELGYERNHVGHGDAFAAETTHECVIDIDVDDSRWFACRLHIVSCSLLFGMITES